MATDSVESISPTPLTRFQVLTFFVLRLVVPLWIGAGAIGKLLSFDPKTLPPPVLDAVLGLGSASGMDLGAFVGGAFRFFIGAELFVALTILFAPRFARMLALSVLGLFCAILALLIAQQFAKGGWSDVAKGGCGCFGKTSLPAWLMFVIDATLLALSVLAPARSGPAGRGVGMAAVIAVVSFGVAFLRPTPILDTASDPDGAQAPTPPLVQSAWPAAPSSYASLFFVKWKDTIGKRLVDIPVFLAIDRPVPSTMLSGPQLIVFYSETCDHCQALFKKHFATPSKTPVLRVAIPLGGDRALPMHCEGCVSSKLFAPKTAKPPEYMLGTPPIIVRAQDGVITDVCTNVDDEVALARILALAPNGAPQPLEPVTPPVDPPSTQAKPWPPLPAQLQGFYVAEFGDLVGKRLDENDFGKLIQKPPAKLNEGRKIVIYYRQDCDHCQELMMTHFTGPLLVETLAVAIPDADPNALLDMACDTCALAQLVKGPDYVIATPIVLSMQDGVVTCIVEDVEDAAKLEACIRGVK